MRRASLSPLAAKGGGRIFCNHLCSNFWTPLPMKEMHWQTGLSLVEGPPRLTTSPLPCFSTRWGEAERTGEKMIQEKPYCCSQLPNGMMWRNAVRIFPEAQEALSMWKIAIWYEKHFQYKGGWAVQWGLRGPAGSPSLEIFKTWLVTIQSIMI